MITQISSENDFQKNVSSNSTDKLVVVDFFATWCGPCKALEKPMEQLSEKYPNASFYKVDVDQLQALAGRLGVRAMPTIMFFKKGNKITEVVGANFPQIEKTVQQNYTAPEKFSGSGRVLGSAPPGYTPPIQQQAPTNNNNSSSTSSQQPTTKPTQPMETDELDDEEVAKAILLSKKQQQQQQQKPAPKPTPAPAESSTATTESTQAQAQADADAVEEAAQADVANQIAASQKIDVNESFLKELEEMGFPTIRCQRALLSTDNQSIEAALNWIEQHENDPDIDAPIIIVNELTPEEKEAKLKAARAKALQLQQEVRRRNAEAEKKADIEREKNRIKSSKEMQAANEIYKEQQRKREMEEIKRQKQKDKEDKARLKALLEQDKLERRAKQHGGEVAETPAPAPAASSNVNTTPSQPAKEYTECEIQIRLTNGQAIKGTFKPTDTIQDVHNYVSKNRTDGQGAFKLMTNFPKKVYESSADLKRTLKEEGLAPRGVLLLTR